MSVVVYPALVASRSGELQAGFVDLPDVVVSAGSPVELIRLARERLAAELQRLERADEAWPAPTSLDHLNQPAAVSVLLVDVSVDDTPVRLTISLGERLLRRIDQDAEARSMSRSGYLALGARGLLSDTTGPTRPGGGQREHRLEEEVAELGRRVTEAVGPDSPVGRTLSELDARALDGLRWLGGEVRAGLCQPKCTGG